MPALLHYKKIGKKKDCAIAQHWPRFLITYYHADLYSRKYFHCIKVCSVQYKPNQGVLGQGGPGYNCSCQDGHKYSRNVFPAKLQSSDINCTLTTHNWPSHGMTHPKSSSSYIDNKIYIRIQSGILSCETNWLNWIKVVLALWSWFGDTQLSAQCVFECKWPNSYIWIGMQMNLFIYNWPVTMHNVQRNQRFLCGAADNHPLYACFWSSVGWIKGYESEKGKKQKSFQS